MKIAAAAALAVSSLFLTHAQGAQNMTPLLLAVQDAPIPFTGSDGQTHLVYELGMTNFSSAEIGVEKVDVLGDGITLEKIGTAEVANRLQPAGLRDSSGTLAASMHANLFIHVVLSPGAKIPSELTHRIALRAAAAPPGHQEFSETGGLTTVDRQPVAQIAPPLSGAGYISADSCCDASRHTRAALPVNGRMWVAQRYAVDWERVNSDGKIYSGPQEKLESYAIFGQPVLAVADARVVSVVDGQPEQSPGKFPANLPIDLADGNSVILDLGNRHYALYAHMQPGSIKVHAGERVHVGQTIGLVGDTGNSIVPHLHFQVNSSPSSLAANGLPYEISAFQITGKTPGTKAFDQAESNGTPLPITAINPPGAVKNALPLDQLIVAFPTH